MEMSSTQVLGVQKEIILPFIPDWVHYAGMSLTLLSVLQIPFWCLITLLSALTQVIILNLLPVPSLPG